MNKVDRAAVFRERLSTAMGTAALSRSALARAAGVNRSTVSQLLDPGAARLPNAHLAAECAQALGVSSDWLLGLTDRPERPAAIVAASVEVARAARAGADDQLLAWQREATGYKIRHVPATLPDMLKTRDVLRWEYAAFLGRTPDQAIGAMEDRMSWMRSGLSDYEIALPLHELTALSRGEGYYRGLPAAARRAQLDLLADQCDALYPTLRVFLFDAKRVFSAPITVFGPLIGAIYIGGVYLAFRDSARIRALVDHFDWLVREAAVDAKDAADHIDALRRAAG
ncbi:MAG: helix-turn-helix transcriptional regulator [Pseudomonadota bacterium]